MTGVLREGGTFLLNCQWSPEELEHRLPAKVKNDLANKNINFYIIDGVKIAAAEHEAWAAVSIRSCSLHILQDCKCNSVCRCQ